MISSEQIVSMAMGDIEKTVQLYPTPDEATPEKLGWEAFIARYPSYVAQYSGSARLLARQNREILSEMSLDRQKLGGAIIRARLTNDEIENYGR